MAMLPPSFAVAGLLFAFTFLVPLTGASAARFIPRPFGDMVFGGPLTNREPLPTAEIGGKLVFFAPKTVLRQQLEGNQPYEYLSFEERIYSTDGLSVKEVESAAIEYRFPQEVGTAGEYFFFEERNAGLLASDGDSFWQADLPRSLRPGFVYLSNPRMLGEHLLVTIGGASIGEQGEILASLDGTSAKSLATFKSRVYLPRDTEVNGSFLFAADDGFYHTDGDTLIQVSDISASRRVLSSEYAKLEGNLFFPAQGTQGIELHKFDSLQVVQVADINPGGDSLAEYMYSAQLDNQLFFTAEGPDGNSFFKTDGTIVSQVASFDSIGISRRLDRFEEHAGRIYFVAEDADGYDLYSMDGNDVVSLDIAQDDAWMPIERFASIGDTVLFATTDVEHNGKLWATDGFSAEPIADLNLFYTSTEFTEYKGELFFPAHGIGGPGLYKSDGKSAQRIGNISGAIAIGPLVEFEEQLFFNVHSQDGSRLFRTDGSDAEEVLFGDANFVSIPFEYRNDLYAFASQGERSGLEGWRLYKIMGVPEPSSFSFLLLGIILLEVKLNHAVRGSHLTAPTCRSRSSPAHRW